MLKSLTVEKLSHGLLCMVRWSKSEKSAENPVELGALDMAVFSILWICATRNEFFLRNSPDSIVWQQTISSFSLIRVSIYCLYCCCAVAQVSFSRSHSVSRSFISPNASSRSVMIVVKCFFSSSSLSVCCFFRCRESRLLYGQLLRPITM